MAVEEYSALKLSNLVGDDLVVGEPVTGNGFEVCPALSRELELEAFGVWFRNEPSGASDPNREQSGFSWWSEDRLTSESEGR